MKNILLTGAGGFVGKALHTVLTQRHYVVRTLPRQWHDTLPALVADFAPYTVIDNAWIGTLPAQREHVRYVNPNLQLLHQLHAMLHRTGCTQRVFIGTQAELNNASLYGQTKRSAAHMLQQLCQHSQMLFRHARLYQVYGEDSHESYLVPSLIAAFKANRMPQLRQPHAKYYWIHVNNVACMIADMLDAPEHNRVCEIHENNYYSVARMAYKLALKYCPRYADACYGMLPDNEK